ncbi:hypothetical protein [Robertmurraya sp.]|uniref:hypothetical protein n=1 Tax=Robertmurraya sp. TaxID=2837525 RepID=UPI00370395D6
MNYTLIEKIFDIYSQEGKVDFLQQRETYRIQAEDSNVFLMQGEDIMHRFRHIQEAVIFLASLDDMQLLTKKGS